MDVTTITNAAVEAAPHFAALVGLICNFRQEKSARKDLTHKDFIEWLEYHRHEDLVKLICNTATLQTEVDNLLQKDTKEIISRLKEVEDMLGKILSRLDGFAGLAKTVIPQSEFSDQVLWILKRMYVENPDHLRFEPHFQYGQPALNFYGSGTGTEQPMDKRFIRDDLDWLESRGLLSSHPTGSKAVIYRHTRDGARTAKLLFADHENKS